MPQPTLSQVHVDRPLTNVSTAYLNDNAANYVAQNVFPRVPVDKRSDLYYVWTKGDWFRGGMRKRGPATESTGGGMGLTTASYSADVWSLHYDLADQIVNNQDPGVDLRMASTRWLQQQALITRDQQWVSKYFTTGVWGTDNTTASKWSDYVNGDPKSDVITAKLAIKSVTGMDPNTLIVGEEVHAKLTLHPLIAEQFKYTSSDSITAAILARYFEVGRYIVAGSVQNTGAEGAADSFSFIAGKHAWLGYVNPAPSLMAPSAGYQFVWNAYGAAGAGMMKSFRMEQLAAERLEIENAWDDKVVGTDLGYFWSSIVT